MTSVVLKVKNLNMDFSLQKGLIFKKETDKIQAVNNVSFDLHRGETLGLVGESGCGKSTLGRTIIRLYQPSSGKITLKQRDITKLEGKELRTVRKSIQMIFQDPYASLNPRMTVFDILAEPILLHKLCENRRELELQIKNLLDIVAIPCSSIFKYPHQFSGGQRQRIAIARALSIRPDIIICDEPVSALDVSIQAQILNLLRNLQKEFNLSYLFIAHDIAAVKYISNKIAVMYLGKIVEMGSKKMLFENPKHPYTKALIDSIPSCDPQKEKAKGYKVLAGEIPSPINPPSGCSFHTRCPIAKNSCRINSPQTVNPKKEHTASCLLVE